MGHLDLCVCASCRRGVDGTRLLRMGVLPTRYACWQAHPSTTVGLGFLRAPPPPPWAWSGTLALAPMSGGHRTCPMGKACCHHDQAWVALSAKLMRWRLPPHRASGTRMLGILPPKDGRMTNPSDQCLPTTKRVHQRLVAYRWCLHCSCRAAAHLLPGGGGAGAVWWARRGDGMSGVVSARHSLLQPMHRHTACSHLGTTILASMVLAGA